MFEMDSTPDLFPLLITPIAQSLALSVTSTRSQNSSGCILSYVFQYYVNFPAASTASFSEINSLWKLGTD